MLKDFKDRASAFGKRNNKICQNIFFMLCQLFVAFIIVLTKSEVTGAIIFGTLVMVQLIMCESILPPLYTIFLISVFVTRLYDSYDTFIKFVWVAIPFVVAVLYHFIVYAKPIKIGQTFFGICAVALSVTLGGVGSISLTEYTNPVALYYVLMLGLGMVIMYLFLSSQIDRDVKNAEFFTKMLLLMGVLACFCVLSFYLFDIKTVLKDKKLLEFQSSNNLATFIMFSLPITFGFARRKKVFLLLAALFYFSLVLTGSRGGLLMGSVELFICFIWYFVSDREHRKFNLGVIALMCLSVVFLYFKWEGLYEFYFGKYPENGLLNGLISKNEVRFKLLKYSIYDFKENIFFGKGLGYSGNIKTYKPVKGALYWYHMWGPQIIGSMGILGILAYGYQLINRLAVTITRRGEHTGMLFLSYLGLLLMSQVNPGEFCPIPYALIAVLIFIIIEKTGKVKKVNKV